MFMAASIPALAPIQGRPKMAIHTPYTTVGIGNATSVNYLNREVGGNLKQTSTLDEIVLNDLKRLIYDFARISSNVGCNDLQELGLPIFIQVFNTLSEVGVNIDQMSLSKTLDDSVLLKANLQNKSFYFEIYFDEDEYPKGYEIIANLYDEKRMVLSVSGSIEFVLKKIQFFLNNDSLIKI
ncbi:MAG: hypothetical protein LCH91_26535 [Bacteroidetes bacterium]|nr:hypothetical protein [Bacteroidota bacterium]